MEEVKNRTPENVPYIVYESTQARNERHIKRLVTALIIAIIMIFASNFMWLAYINQYDFAEYEYTQAVSLTQDAEIRVADILAKAAKVILAMKHAMRCCPISAT